MMIGDFLGGLVIMLVVLVVIDPGSDHWIQWSFVCVKIPLDTGSRKLWILDRYRVFWIQSLKTLDLPNGT
jgi:hypothetical protein